MVKDIPAFWHWQAAAKRLIGDRAAVMFSDVGLGDGVWGTCYFYRGYKVIQIRENLPLMDGIRTLIHEALHFVNDKPPTLAGGKFEGLKASWHEPAIYAAESKIMIDLEQRWAKLPTIKPDLFQVAPGLRSRVAAWHLDLVGRMS